MALLATAAIITTALAGYQAVEAKQGQIEQRQRIGAAQARRRAQIEAARREQADQDRTNRINAEKIAARSAFLRMKGRTAKRGASAGGVGSLGASGSLG